MQYSVVTKSNLDKIVLRIDAEFYHPDSIQLEKKIDSLKTITLREAMGKLDCSAFYPSIVEYYTLDRTGMPFLRVDEIQNGLLDLTSNTVFLPTKIVYENKNTIARCYAWDIVIAKGGNTIAKVALLTDEHKEYATCRDLIVLRTEKLTELKKFFLWIFLHSEYGKKSLLRTASQTGQPHLTIEALYELRIPKFSTVFQNRFEELHSMIRRQQAASLNTYRQAEQILLSELGLQDWKPEHQLSFTKNFSVSKNANRIDAEYFQPRYDELKRMLNRGKCNPLGDCFELISSNYFDYVSEGDVGVIKTKQLSGRFISFEVESKTSKKILQDNKLPKIRHKDVLFACMGVGSLGKANIYYEFENSTKTEFTIDSTIRIMRQKQNSDIRPELLALFLSSVVGQELIYQNTVGTSGIISIYKHYLENIPIPLLDQRTRENLSAHVVQAHESRIKAKKLLEIAKRGVEIAIEKSEKEATSWLNEEVTGRCQITM
jgi:type I restriction enzyme S subunit